MVWEEWDLIWLWITYKDCILNVGQTTCVRLASRCGSGTLRKGGFVISENVKARNTVIIFLHIDPFKMEVIERLAG